MNTISIGVHKYLIVKENVEHTTCSSQMLWK